MHFVDFHIPARVIPIRALHLPEHSLHIFPSAKSCTIRQQFARPALGVLMYGERDALSAERVGHVLADIVTLIGSTVPENEAHAWLNDQRLNIHRVADNLTETESYLPRLKQLALSEIEPRMGYQIACDFENMALPTFPPQGPILDFSRALNMLLYLPEQDRLKSKIKLFHVASCSSLIIGRVYRNQNLKLSLLLTLLESMLPSGSKIRVSTCSNCGHTTEEKRGMSTSERIDSYVDDLGGGETDKTLFKKVIKQLFRRARNPFYHAGKVANEHDMVENLVEQLGRSHIMLSDEIEYGEPRISGALALENHLRLVLFDGLFGLAEGEHGRTT